ncbi:MAG: S41 family peptidase [Bacteroidaceae bacterium]
MKKSFIACLLLFVVKMSAGTVNEPPMWLRQSSISPDGKTLVLMYQGNLYTVPTSGGKAFALTTSSSYDTQPVWSPDGKWIAFSSNRFGSFDVFVIPSIGGAAKRLTTHSANEMVETFTDNTHLVYTSSVQPLAEDGVFPAAYYTQVYEVDTEAHRPRLFSSLTMQNLSINTAGEVLYEDVKGYEDPWRKHHTSPICRDIWKMQTHNSKPTYTQLSTLSGEHRNPVWAADGQSYYYLNERSGSMNVYKVSGGKETQLTTFTKNPVRYLSAARNGTLCFSYDGALYTMCEGQQPRKLNVDIVKDDTRRKDFPQAYESGCRSLAVSKDEKEIVFIVRGDVYATVMDYKTTKRLTHTPEEERNVDISPDGRSVIYASERNGVWGIYRTSLVRKDDNLFTYAHELKEEPLIVGTEVCFQPKFSPDGKEIAYLANRSELRVYNLAHKTSRVVLPAKFNYSYTDGDVWFKWSPDSKWFLTPYLGIGGWQNIDVAAVKADGSKVVNLTESGYSDSNANWALDGKAVVWQSDRAGYRSHGSWGATTDAYIMFLDGKAYDTFQMNKEERALYEEREKAKKEETKKKTETKEKSKKERKSDKKKENKDTTLVTPELQFDFENRKDRIERLTGNSSFLGDCYLSKNGRKLYYQASFEAGGDLWVHDLDDQSTRILIKNFNGGNMIPDKSGDYVYVGGGSLRKVRLSDGNITYLSFRAETTYNPERERTYIYDHITQLIKNKFYTQDLDGVDWEGYTKAYKRFLPQIANNYDFRDLLSELLGELNASHTGARYGGTSAPETTASLGVFVDESYQGDGLRIQEILEQSPLSSADSKVKPSYIITKIDGQPILKDADYYPLLADKEGERVVLTVTDENGKHAFEQEMKPISSATERALRYNRWVKKRQQLTESYSKGQVGYVHVKGMDSESFRKVYSDLLGLYRNKKAIVIDTRHNGGGWLHNDLAILLSGKLFQTYEPRGQYIGSDPYSRWYKPSAVLVCEDNYSNANGFPFMYQYLGIGKLIGAPMAGTMTAVWWEGQVDGSLVFGVPQVGIKDTKGHYLENQDLNPDIKVYITPEEQLRGEDMQLKRAIDDLLQ